MNHPYMNLIPDQRFVCWWAPPTPPTPTTEDLDLEHLARQVENDARPLFAAAWIWLLQRALQHDDEQPA